jgi:hypothetical protein
MIKNDKAESLSLKASVFKNVSRHHIAGSKASLCIQEKITSEIIGLKPAQGRYAEAGVKLGVM